MLRGKNGKAMEAFAVAVVAQLATVVIVVMNRVRQWKQQRLQWHRLRTDRLGELTLEAPNVMTTLPSAMESLSGHWPLDRRGGACRRVPCPSARASSSAGAV